MLTMERREQIIVAVIIVLLILFFVYHNGTERMSVNKRPTFVMFHTTWCGYCKKAMPEWKRFIGLMNQHKAEGRRGHDNLALLTIDAEQQPKQAAIHHVSGYPTIMFLPNGMGSHVGAVVYNGARTTPAMLDWAHSLL